MKKLFLYCYFIVFNHLGLSIFLTACIFFSANGHAYEKLPIDIVFDLDWTLIKISDEEMAKIEPENIIKHNEDYYRIADHAIDLLIELHQQPDVRVSFFSGGLKERNEFVIKHIYNLVNAKLGNSQFRPYKILSFGHLTTISENKNLRFFQRYKKNLDKFFDLRSVLLIDDAPEAVFFEHIKNLLWTGRTYNDRPRYDLVNPADKYAAPSEAEWKREKNKLLDIKKIIFAAIQYSRAHSTYFVDSVQILKSKPLLCSQVFLLN